MEGLAHAICMLSLCLHLPPEVTSPVPPGGYTWDGLET